MMAEELAAIVTEMGQLYSDAIEDSGHTEHRVYSAQRFEILSWQHWRTIRAALERKAELEAALGKGVELVANLVNALYPANDWRPLSVREWVSRVEALLAEPAAKEGERG